jgi:hypothetical protein
MRLLAFLLALGGLGSCGREAAYPPQYEFNFMQACEAQQPAAGVCACIWGRIEAEVPRAQFEALEQSPAASRAQDPLTLRIQEFALACAGPPAEPATP